MLVRQMSSVEKRVGPPSALRLITPSEILVPDSLTDEVKAIVPELAVHNMPAWHFDAERGRELLKKKFKLNNLEAWGIEDNTLILTAVNALLSSHRFRMLFDGNRQKD